MKVKINYVSFLYPFVKVTISDLALLIFSIVYRLFLFYLLQKKGFRKSFEIIPYNYTISLILKWL